MRVAVDREHAARIERHRDQVVGRILTLGPGVHLDGDAVRGAGGEDGGGVERRAGTGAA
jgi:hypothetical protein